jgi:hypothetical protein
MEDFEHRSTPARGLTGLTLSFWLGGQRERDAIMLNRRMLVTKLVCAGAGASVLRVRGALAANTLTLVGSKVKWRGELRSGWVGGNAQQIERVLRTAENDTLRRIMELMLPESKGLDLFFIHLDTTAMSTDRPSTLRSNSMTLKSLFQSDAARRQIFDAFVENMNRDSSGKSTTVLESDKSGTTGGRPSATAVLRTDVKTGGAYYDLFHFVRISDEDIHLLRLECDRNKYKDRSSEFYDLLKSIEYTA